MDDRSFDDPKVALDWIQTIESERAKIREIDLYPRLRTWIDQTAPLKILDVGCGQGACSDQINLKDRSYVGVEPSLRLLDRAKELYPQSNRSFVLGNAYHLPVSANEFDAAFSISVWHLLSDLNTAAAEVARVLKKNGRFLIMTANPDSYPKWTEGYAHTRVNGIRCEGETQVNGNTLVDVLYLHSRVEILNSLTNAGFKINTIEAFREDRFLLIEAYCAQ